MAITASKPAINIREKLAELNQPQGIKGREVLRADTADEVRNAIGARGRKNLLINGGFDVWQRGTSFIGVGTADYQTDRFQGRRGTITANVTKGSSTLPNNSVVNTFKITATSSASGYLGLSQVFEQSVFDYIDNRTVTLSCWIKTNRTDITFRHTATTNISTSSYTADGTWQRVSAVYLTPTGTTHNQFDILSFASGLSSHAVGDYLEVAQVQLELGDQATEFEHRSYGEELALCQRYGWNPAVIVGARVGLGQCVSTVVADIHLTHPVPMRDSPSMTIIDPTGGNITKSAGSFVATTNIVLQSSTPNTTRLRVNVASGLVVGGLTMMTFDNVDDIFIAAEL
jgi:hypothetical protein